MNTANAAGDKLIKLIVKQYILKEKRNYIPLQILFKNLKLLFDLIISKISSDDFPCIIEIALLFLFFFYYLFNKKVTKDEDHELKRYFTIFLLSFLMNEVNQIN